MLTDDGEITCCQVAHALNDRSIPNLQFAQRPNDAPMADNEQAVLAAATQHLVQLLTRRRGGPAH